MIQANEGFFVYKIINLINNKIYFGVTKCSIRKRWNEHRHAAMRQKKKTFLAKAMFKYGVANFSIELIKDCATEKEMYETEIILIMASNSNNRLCGYNNSNGGEVSSKGMKHSQETKNYLSKIQSGKKRQQHSLETRKKMSESAKGRDMIKVVEVSAKNRRGVPLSDGRRAKLSQAGKDKNTVSVVMMDRLFNKIRCFKSIVEATEITGISQPCISNVLTNRAKTAGGYIWQYSQMN